ncbi:hypothetical protein HYW53_00655 [Candidatus Giovannonibacteria bacterium]|nr:hypothetical protein [Candidatus Giovannonibacteria bacterium]
MSEQTALLARGIESRSVVARARATARQGRENLRAAASKLFVTNSRHLHAKI